ncbi:MAG: DUF1343 domain-containing protein [Anaerolineae bacterium]|nr:DUF1343 domain-containing protein [Anaerolineae bacterium]
MAQVQTGIEVLRANQFAQLKGKRVGLFTNLNAVDNNLVSTYDILRLAPEVNLTAIFSPEHGLAAALADGQLIGSSVDVRTGLPIHSLYGPSEHPTAEMLAGVDVIVCDSQDIGVRYYTFTWTMSHILEAACEHSVEIIILDRPNPLGGYPFGTPLDMHFASLVGRYPVPTQPGMTMGELAQLFNIQWNPTPAQVSVIACKNYHRSMTWEQTGLTFVPPSPNMPRLITAQHYPGACLVEGTSLSEGRGTALPFEIVGAPALDGYALAETLNAHNWAGVRFRPHVFQPNASKYEGELCAGVQAHITDAQTYQPLPVWLDVLAAIYQQQPFTWNDHFERLIGTDKVRTLIETNASFDTLFSEWKSTCSDFNQLRQPYLIYED